MGQRLLQPVGVRTGSQRKRPGTDTGGQTEARGERETGMGSQATRAAKERRHREGHAQRATSSLRRLDSVRCEK